MVLLMPVNAPFSSLTSFTNDVPSGAPEKSKRPTCRATRDSRLRLRPMRAPAIQPTGSINIIKATMAHISFRRLAGKSPNNSSTGAVNSRRMSCSGHA